eukprot:1992461-Rhodomonas_salina.1
MGPECCLSGQQAPDGTYGMGAWLQRGVGWEFLMLWVTNQSVTLCASDRNTVCTSCDVLNAGP